jgi:CxxC motif-containing protein (DUF1111 family)
MAALLLKLPKNHSFKFLVLLALGIIAGIVLSILLGRQVWQPATPPLAGGATTVFNRSSRGFSLPAPNLSPAQLEQHLAGDGDFDAVFVTAPALVNAGLGPRFNNASCNGCHLNDGRGMPNIGQSLVRVSLPQGQSQVAGGAVPVPGIGTQIRTSAIYGQPPDAIVAIQWQEQGGKYGDGTPYRLRSPRLEIARPDGQPLPPGMLTSLRVPPPIFGRGLLEAIPESTILSLADPQDQNQDGVSGRANFVWDLQTQTTTLGRFGLKANAPTLLQQTAAAYVNDMGVTNPLFPDQDGSKDIDRQTLDNATFYTQTLAVPARTLLDDPLVQQGEHLFTQANCAACHLPTLQTGNHPIKALANQTIHPYTDMLLHDLGAGLADDRPDFAASGSEWRTSPLWGLGLTQTVLPYSGYLHDGRARTLEEAILWHGGEAERAKETFKTLSAQDRQALLKFLNSL